MDQECVFEGKLLAIPLWLALRGSLRAGTHWAFFQQQLNWKVRRVVSPQEQARGTLENSP